MKPTISSKKILMLLGIALLSYLQLALAAIAFILEDYILSAVLVVSSIITSMGFPAALICLIINNKLDDRFDRLEKFLDKEKNKE
jgi:predicted membrane-bound spermidine synthase